MHAKSVYVIVVLFALSSHVAHVATLSSDTPPAKDAASSATSAAKDAASSATSAAKDAASSATSAAKDAASSTPASGGRWGTWVTQAGWSAMASVKDKVMSNIPSGMPSTGDVLNAVTAVKDKIGSFLPPGIPSSNDVWLAAVGLKDQSLAKLPTDFTLPVVTEAAWKGVAGVKDTVTATVQAADQMRAKAIVDLYSKVGNVTNMILNCTDNWKKMATDNIEAGKTMGINSVEDAKKYLQENQEAVKSVLKGITENTIVKAAIKALDIKDPNALINNGVFQTLVLTFAPPPVAAALRLATSEHGQKLINDGPSVDLLKEAVLPVAAGLAAGKALQMGGAATAAMQMSGTGNNANQMLIGAAQTLLAANGGKIDGASGSEGLLKAIQAISNANTGSTGGTAGSDALSKAAGSYLAANGGKIDGASGTEGLLKAVQAISTANTGNTGGTAVSDALSKAAGSYLAANGGKIDGVSGTEGLLKAVQAISTANMWNTGGTAGSDVLSKAFQAISAGNTGNTGGTAGSDVLSKAAETKVGDSKNEELEKGKEVPLS